MENLSNGEDMFKYVGDYTLYDVIGEYYPRLNGNYSTENLLGNIDSSMDESNHESIHNLKKTLENLVDRLLDRIKKTKNGEVTGISEQEIDELYEEFKTVSENNSSELSEKVLKLIEIAKKERNSDDVQNKLDRLYEEFKKNKANKIEPQNDIESYLEYTKKHLENDLLRKKMVEAVFKYGDLNIEEKEKYRDIAIQTYILSIEKYLNSKYTEEERNNPRNQEYKTFEILSNLGISKNRKFYDEYLSQNKINVDEQTAESLNKIEEDNKNYEETKKRVNIKNRCLSTRNYRVLNELYDSLPEIEQHKIEEGKTRDVVSALLGDYKEYRTPKEGTYICKFEEKEPEIILDTVAKYADDEIPNQRVIAVSYGFLTYGTDISQYTNSPTRSSLYELELIGVTRKGVEGNSTYFTFAIFDDAKVKAKSQVTQDDNVCSYIKGKERKTGEELAIVKPKVRIPKELEKYYAEVFFSDAYMQAVEKAYDGYSGTVDKTTETPHITSGTKKLIDLKPCEAVKYVKKHPIIWKNKLQNIQEYYDSSNIKQKQEKIVEDAIKRNNGVFSTDQYSDDMK